MLLFTKVWNPAKSIKRKQQPKMNKFICTCRQVYITRPNYAWWVWLFL